MAFALSVAGCATSMRSFYIFCSKLYKQHSNGTSVKASSRCRLLLIVTSLVKMAAYVSRGSDFPVSSCQAAVSVQGLHTDIHCSVFSNQLYLVVTQFCKLGTLIHVKPETVVNELEGPAPLLATKVLFGKDEPLMHVMARHIVASLKSSQPVLLGLCLHDTSRDMVFSLLPAIQSCVATALGTSPSQSIGGDVLCR